MKVAVTGGSGFVGRHVIVELARRGIKPIIAARPSSQLPDDLAGFPVVRLDLADPPPNSYELLGRPDKLIHLAWDGLPNYGSLHHFETELPLQYRFLKQLIDAGLPNLLVSGTCFEYGMQSGELHESMEPSPENPYGFAKDALRRQLEFLRGQRSFQLTWARLFYIYGSGQSTKSLYSQLVAAATRGEAVFNMSGGEQLRDYLSISEAAHHLVSLGLLKDGAGIVNICSGVPISVRCLVQRWIDESQWPIRMNLGHYPYPPHEPMAFWGDATKLARYSGGTL